MKIPILQLKGILLTSIQVDLTDHDRGDSMVLPSISWSYHVSAARGSSVPSAPDAVIAELSNWDMQSSSLSLAERFR